MDKVVKTCSICGEELTLKHDQLYCPNCKKIYLDILGEFVGDATEMTAIEFAQKMEKSGKQFVINIDDKIDANDVDALVLNKKIQTAILDVESGRFDDALAALTDVKNANFAVYRLCLLASMRVKNERGLLHSKNNIDDNFYFKQAIAVADADTKATYLEIAKFCKENNANRVSMMAEVNKLEELISVGLKNEAVIFAKGMCGKYPQYVYAWSAYYYVQYLTGVLDDETWNKIEKSLDDGEFYPGFLKILGNDNITTLKDFTETEITKSHARKKRYPVQLTVAFVAFALAILTVVIAVKDWGFGYLLLAWVPSLLTMFYALGSYYDDKLGVNENAISNERKKQFGIKTLKVVTKITSILLILTFILAISSCGINCGNVFGCN